MARRAHREAEQASAAALARAQAAEAERDRAVARVEAERDREVSLAQADRDRALTRTEAAETSRGAAVGEAPVRRRPSVTGSRRSSLWSGLGCPTCGHSSTWPGPRPVSYASGRSPPSFAWLPIPLRSLRRERGRSSGFAAKEAVIKHTRAIEAGQ